MLTDAGDDVELVVDLLVHGRGDDADLREGVGHRVHAHLRHEQGQQEDLVFCYVVVLEGKVWRSRQRTRATSVKAAMGACDVPAGL